MDQTSEFSSIANQVLDFVRNKGGTVFVTELLDNFEEENLHIEAGRVALQLVVDRRLYYTEDRKLALSSDSISTYEVKEDRGEISDGYHTFNELYEHRYALFLALMAAHKDKAWLSLRHSDGEIPFDGNWLIAGINFGEGGDVTYHFPMIYYPHLVRTGAKVLDIAPYWDGHTSQDVVARLIRVSRNQ